LIQVDGVTVARLDELVPDAGRYEWTDSGQVAPTRPHTLEVRAVEGEARSPAADIYDSGTTAKGLWIIPEADIDPIVLADAAVGGFSRTDYRATYVNSIGEEIDVFYGTPPRTGDLEGIVGGRDDDLWATLDRVAALRASRNRRAQIVWGSQSEAARVRDIDATSADGMRPNNPRHVVRGSFVGLDD
jgi:hypothetical protein